MRLAVVRPLAVRGRNHNLRCILKPGVEGGFLPLAVSAARVRLLGHEAVIHTGRLRAGLIVVPAHKDEIVLRHCRGTIGFTGNLVDRFIVAGHHAAVQRHIVQRDGALVINVHHHVAVAHRPLYQGLVGNIAVDHGRQHIVALVGAQRLPMGGRSGFALTIHRTVKVIHRQLIGHVGVVELQLILLVGLGQIALVAADPLVIHIGVQAAEAIHEVLVGQQLIGGQHLCGFALQLGIVRRVSLLPIVGQHVIADLDLGRGRRLFLHEKGNLTQGVPGAAGAVTVKGVANLLAQPDRLHGILINAGDDIHLARIRVGEFLSHEIGQIHTTELGGVRVIAHI